MRGWGSSMRDLPHGRRRLVQCALFLHGWVQRPTCRSPQGLVNAVHKAVLGRDGVYEYVLHVHVCAVNYVEVGNVVYSSLAEEYSSKTVRQ
jgi:hypothetical protein